jgi:SAM-dependent methyltransferase
VTAVDPLADHYRGLLERFDLKPPVETIACRGEEVAERFGENSFDVGYSRNALDHAADPIQAIESLVGVVRPGGAIVLTHNRREGEAQHYEQLHQWNFDVQEGRFVVYNRTTFHDIGERLGRQVAITARVFETPHGAWVAATLHLADGDSA